MRLINHEYYFSNQRVLPEFIEGIRVLKGAEINILNFQGDVDLDPRSLSFLDYAIASIHLPCIKAGTIEEKPMQSSTPCATK